jgi:hypothetical protein
MSNDSMATRESVLAELAPQFRQLEAERAERSQRLKQHIIASVAAGGTMALVVLVILGWSWRGIAFLVVLGGAGLAIYLALRAQRSWSSTVLAQVMPALCKAWGEVRYQLDAPRKDFVDPFQTLHAVGNHNRRRLEHYFAGRAGARRFEMLHADLTLASGGRNSSSTPVFYGLLIRIQLFAPVPLPILVAPNDRLFGKIRDMTQVSLELPEFNEKFMVHVPADRQDGPGRARDVLDSQWQQALLAVNAGEGRLIQNRAALRIGLIEDSCYIALSRWGGGGSVGKIRFERPRPFLDVPFVLKGTVGLEDSVRTMLDDIGVIFRVIEQLPDQSEC